MNLFKFDVNGGLLWKKNYKANRIAILARSSAYVKNNKDKVAAYKHAYYLANKAELNKEASAYYQANRKQLCISSKRYYHSNKEKVSEQSKAYYLKNLDHIIARTGKYVKDNKDKANAWARKYVRNKRKIDFAYRLNCNISRAIGASLRGNKAGRHWETLVNYSQDTLRKHLQSLFKKGITWDNYGKWHIDHI